MCLFYPQSGRVSKGTGALALGGDAVEGWAWPGDREQPRDCKRIRNRARGSFPEAPRKPWLLLWLNVLHGTTVGPARSTTGSLGAPGAARALAPVSSRGIAWGARVRSPHSAILRKGALGELAGSAGPRRTPVLAPQCLSARCPGPLAQRSPSPPTRVRPSTQAPAAQVRTCGHSSSRPGLLHTCVLRHQHDTSGLC